MESNGGTNVTVNVMNLFGVKCCVLVLIVLYLSGPIYGAEKQKRGGQLGVGVVLGDPTGIAGKLRLRGNRAIDGLAAWSIGRDRFFVHSHYLYHFQETLEDEQFVFYLGPGGYARLGGAKDRLGVSGNFGLAYNVDQFEIFLEISPKVSIIPDTDGDLTGGLGFHYYF